ncbi:class I mannose-6-phosphate isomerase [Sporobolomyces salmoneus]|uniref:class I mannose-6-phosphate isomerase n=1 Tax=Sporobolomyces salmoneus TaxID=183962 RepID=UPI003172DAC8
MTASIVQLTPFLQPFPYGKNGHESLAARYCLSTPGSKARIEKDGGIKPDQPYGECWFNTHQNGPAYVEGTEKQLRDLVREDPEKWLGKKLLNDEQMRSQYENDVPYLFKVLSFDKPLPLQCHPDKKLGEKLKEQEAQEKGKNEDFVDGNAKPEVGVALSDYFTAFVGFRPPHQLAKIIKSVPEFTSMFSSSTLSKLDNLVSSSSSSSSDIESVLRSLFTESINLSSTQVKPLVQKLSTRLEKEGAETVFGSANEFNAQGDANATKETEAEAMKRVWELSVKVYGEEDVGVLVSTCLMNLLRMRKGEGAWILADDLHAYVEGDIIECMANSDNMVAHGLGTEEQGGISTFAEMLSYRHLPASKLLLEYEDSSKYGEKGATRYYKIPIAEFDLLSISLSSSTSSSETISPLDGPFTFVVTEGNVKVTIDGEGIELSKGQAGFVAANSKISIENTKEGETAELWGAFYQ